MSDDHDGEVGRSRISKEDSMKTLITAAFLICIFGCSNPDRNYSAQGTVRNLWCAEYLAGTFCHVNFEHDDGKLQELTVYGPPPLWTGLHCKIAYHDDDAGVSRISFAERLGQ